MTDECRRSLSSRRRFLGAVAGAITAVGTAGCFGSLAGSGSSNRIEPEEPSEPREGSPGEFYYFLESNGIEVDELARDGDDLYLTYRSEAETIEESDDEILIVYEVYKRALIHRGSEVEFLYTEISNPFDGQALGWGINSQWIHQYDNAEMAGNESDSLEDGDELAANDTDDGETADNETAMDGLDMNFVRVWNNIMNSKVYEEDLENADGNETESDD